MDNNDNFIGRIKQVKTNAVIAAISKENNFFRVFFQYKCEGFLRYADYLFQPKKGTDYVPSRFVKLIKAALYKNDEISAIVYRLSPGDNFDLKRLIGTTVLLSCDAKEKNNHLYYDVNAVEPTIVQKKLVRQFPIDYHLLDYKKSSSILLCSSCVVMIGLDNPNNIELVDNMYCVIE